MTLSVNPLERASEFEQAKQSYRALSAHYKPGEPLQMKILDRDGEELSLPPQVVQLLVEVLVNLANGKALSIIPTNAELTTQQAADILNVSRPFLIKLLDETREISFRKVGTHRRILLKDLLAYKEMDDATRDQALDELVAQGQELKLG